MFERKDMLECLHSRVVGGQSVVWALSEMFAVDIDTSNLRQESTESDIAYVEGHMKSDRIPSARFIRDQLVGKAFDARFFQDLMMMSKSMPKIISQLNLRMLKTEKNRVLEDIALEIERIRSIYFSIPAQKSTPLAVFKALTGYISPSITSEEIRAKLISEFGGGDEGAAAIALNSRNGIFTVNNGAMFYVRDQIALAYPSASEHFRVRIHHERLGTDKVETLLMVESLKGGGIGVMSFGRITELPSTNDIVRRFDHATKERRAKLGLCSWAELDEELADKIKEFKVIVSEIPFDLREYLTLRSESKYEKGCYGFPKGSIERLLSMDDESIYDWISSLTWQSMHAKMFWSNNDKARFLKVKAHVVLSLFASGRITNVGVIKRKNEGLIRGIKSVEFSELSIETLKKFKLALLAKISSHKIMNTKMLNEAIINDPSAFISAKKGAHQLLGKVLPELVFTTAFSKTCPDEMLIGKDSPKGIKAGSAWPTNLGYLAQVCPDYYDLVEFTLADKKIYIPLVHSMIVNWMDSNKIDAVREAEPKEQFREVLPEGFDPLKCDMYQHLLDGGCSVHALGLSKSANQKVWNLHLAQLRGSWKLISSEEDQKNECA